MEKRDIDECLEILWHLTENNELDLDNFRRHMKSECNDDIIEILELEGYIYVEKNRIQLTNEGEEKAREIVRRHRLAERLLTDVLGMKSGEVETGACEFEHILAPGIVESICTFLGHPRQCPHGSRIPEGRCCKEKKQVISSAVMPLDRGKVGETYKVAYINTSSNSRMHKLVHFGVNPGAHITLHQSYPSFVIKSEDSQLALEEEIAREIYVWKNGGS